MKPKTTLLFDMYGVILKESKGNFIPYTFTYFQQEEHDRLTRQFREEKLFTKAGNGEITSDEFLTLLGYEDPAYHMKNYLENYLTLDEGFISFAEKYYQEFDFVLLSNDVAAWSEYITEFYGLNKYFKAKIVSADVKCRKPEKRIYEMALAEISRSGQECYFVDNSVKNLDVAEGFGISPILFNRDDEEYTGVIVNSFEELAKILEAN